MRYTVLSRFQGALLGAALGEILGANCSDRLAAQSIDAVSLPWLTVHQWGFQPLFSGNRTGWGRAAVQHLRSLLQLDASPQLDLPLDLGLAVATLPIALFHHENPDRMQAHLRQTIPSLRGDGADEQTIGILLISYTLSLILREQFSPTQLIPDLIRYFDLPQTYPLLAQQLSNLQPNSLPTSPLLAALTAFLRTPDSCRLSLLQAAQTPASMQPAVVCAIAGALCGAYNGRGGLPLDWSLALNRTCSSSLLSGGSAAPHSATDPNLLSSTGTNSATATDPVSVANANKAVSDRLPSALSLLWDVNCESELLEYAHRLFITWSGVCNSIQWAQHSGHLTDPPVIAAAPRVVRPR
ncbi:ADP-ribosylglycohydrolase family protein [Phormidium tenue FACHB-886]|nr:ADP-ribosylglycohydrolase family protein [Phormidium tenue FACHB-886]